MKVLEGNGQAADQRLDALIGRFPRGIHLSREDLGLLAWLYLYEEETGAQEFSDPDLKRLLSEGLDRCAPEPPPHQPAQIIQRFMRIGMLRIAIPDSGRRGYRLTCLARGLVRNVMQRVDYGAEQLTVLFQCALSGVQAAAARGSPVLLKHLQHAFLGTIREKIEYKLLSIEEDLEERKGEVRRTYSAQNQADFEAAISDVEYCRRALTEMVDAVQEYSACVQLESRFHEYLLEEPDLELADTLEQSLHFLYTLRAKMEGLLKDVIQFIRDCIACRSLAFTVDSRDRLCRIQEGILSFVLEHDVRMPIPTLPGVPRLDIQWKEQERAHPVLLDTTGIRTLQSFLPPELPAVEPDWKDPLLQTARVDWSSRAREGGVEVSGWLERLSSKIPEALESPHLMIWFLSQDWANWTPAVALEHERGQWVALGRDWWMESVRLTPRGETGRGKRRTS